MKKTKYELKLLTSNIFFFILFLSGYAYAFGNLFQKNHITNSYTVYNVWLYKSNLIPFCYIHFILIHLISFFIFETEKRSHLEEALQNDVTKKISNFRFFLLVILNGFIFILTTAFTLCSYFLGFNHDVLHLCRETVVMSFIGYNFAFVFLTGVISIFLGYFTNKIQWKYLQIIFFMFIQFFFGLPMLWIEKNLLLRFYDYPILNFFLNLSAILPGEMNVATDAYNIDPVQCHRWILLLFWLFLLSTIYIVLNNKNKSIKNTGFKTVLFSASIVMFVLSLLPFSSISGNCRAHLRSLNVNNELHTAADKIDEPANFLVEKYSMDIYAYLNLQFRV